MTRKPLDQGDLDGFCGLYAITNAITLLFPGTMNQDRRDRVFKVLLKAIPQHRWPSVVVDGTTERDVRAMLAAATLALKKSFVWEQPFRRQYFAHFGEFERELGWRIKGDDAFAIVGISKPWDIGRVRIGSRRVK